MEEDGLGGVCRTFETVRNAGRIRERNLKKRERLRHPVVGGRIFLKQILEYSTGHEVTGFD
jgi:hypothetical protein